MYCTYSGSSLTTKRLLPFGIHVSTHGGVRTHVHIVETWQPDKSKAMVYVHYTCTCVNTPKCVCTLLAINMSVCIINFFTVGTNEHNVEQLRHALEQAKSHPLFPVLDYMAKRLHAQNEKLDTIGTKLARLEAEITVKFPASQKGVKDLILEQSKQTEYEVHIHIV